MHKHEFIERVREARPDYRPSDETLEAIEGVSLAVLMGPSGAGKDTVRRRLWLPILVSDTIRPPEIRNGREEVSGIDYVFRGKELAKVWKDIKNGKYVQLGMGPDYKSFYGSHIDRYPESGLIVADFMAEQMDEVNALPFAKVNWFYVVPHNVDAWKTRLNKRGSLSEENLAGRYAEATHSLKIAINSPELTIIINEDFRRAAADISNVLFRGHIDEQRQEQGRETLEAMLEQLQAA